VEEYAEALDEILVKTEDGLKYVPELYTVSADKVELEYRQPHSQDRVPIGQIPFMWAQSLYIIGRLVQEGFLAPGELDPLNRRLSSEKKPDVVVQVVILAEDSIIQEKLRGHEIHVQTAFEVSPIEVQPARVLSHIYAYLGKNRKMNLSGRQSRDVGLLSTSKLYTLQDKIFAFTPQNLDREDSYLVNDVELMANTLRSDIGFLSSNWRMLGRPTVSIILHHHHLENDKIPLAMVSTIKKLKSGYINGTRVALGTLDEFLSTSCITSLSFLGNQEEGDPDSLHLMVKEYLERELHKPLSRPSLPKKRPKRKLSMIRSRRSGISGIIKRTRSIQVDQYDPGKSSMENSRKDDLARLRASYDKHSRSPPTSPGPEAVSIQSESSYSSPTESRDRSPSPSQEDDEQWETVARVRTTSDLQFEHVTEDELLGMLRETDNLEELGDLLHFLVVTKHVSLLHQTQSGNKMKN
ncbi:probable phosphorylase b kinase regulatory subunit alpha, partial [Limulus polyphemus]|uniref:Phosphorylase b kinase regulatory subunit n=1 Tax=Limulus polyphemus TaxID=6850 RepID=A0ABM1RWW3_LIMPO